MSLLAPVWAKVQQYEKDITFHTNEARRLTREKSELWEQIVTEIYHDDEKASDAYKIWLKQNNIY